MNASRLLLLSLALAPSILMGQKKEELVSIQRDVAQLEEQMKQLQKSLDDKVASLTAMLQQSIDASNKASAAISSMQRNVDDKLADQQLKLVAPVATLGNKVDEMSGDFRSVRENVAEMRRKVNDMDDKITDISSAVRTLNAPAVAPPPPAANGTAAPVSEGPPAGMSAELSYQQAYSDYSGKKDDLAIEEFATYLKYFSTTANAPNAQYYIGQIYYRAQDWANAAKAFDAVLEHFPKNAKTPEAQYMKACALMNDQQKNAAGKEFRNFLATYPESSHAATAHKYLRAMGMETPAAPRRKQ